MFLEIIASVSLTIFTAAVPIVVRIIMRKMNLEEDQALRANLETALQSAAGIAYSRAAHGMRPADAVSVGATYVSSRMGDTMAKLDLPPSAAGPMVEARVGQLMAADPTVRGPQQ